MDDKQKFFFIWLIFTCVNLTKCFPVTKYNSENVTEIKDETRYPNGTVVGKYTYIDHEGTPVHVKYFANDRSYGVEIKSVKAYDPNNKVMYPSDQSSQPATEKPLESALPSLYTGDYYGKLKQYDLPTKGNKNKDFDMPKKEFDVNKEFGIKRAHNIDKPDYDVFVKNDLQVPKNCKDKVRIYIDKLTRKNRDIRNYYNKYKLLPEYCDNKLK